MKRALLLLPALVLAAGCGSSHPQATRTSRPQAARVSLRVPTQAENAVAARRDAERLLRAFRPPAGSRRMHWRRGRNDSPGFLERYRAWRVPRPLAAVQAFLRAHHERGGPLPGAGRWSTSRFLAVTTSPLPGGATAVRVLAIEIYVLPLPRRDRVPTAATSIEVRSRWRTTQPPFLSRRVADPAEVRRIVGWFDLLSRVQPRIGCVLPARVGPEVTLVFRGADGRVLARANVLDTEPRLTGCDSFQLAVGTRKPVRVVGGDVLRKVERLLGIDLFPHPVMPRLRCPAKAPRLRRTAGASAHRLVSPYAEELLLCRYSGLNSTHPLGLARSRRIGTPRRIDSLIRLLDALHRAPHGIYNCPFDDGSEILLEFGYPGGRVERVTVALSGCAFATNGRIGRFTTGRLIDRLLALTRGRAGAS